MSVPASLSMPDVERPVRARLDAYNARDIDRFMQWWADHCHSDALPSILLAHDAVEIRERHVERFKEINLHGTLVQPIIVGNIVVDQEVVQRTFPQGPGEIDVMGIHEVEAGKIVEAWFKLGPRRLE